MSARQRHSRIATSDGWTTISASASRKSKPGSKSGSKPHAVHSALLAHRSDLADPPADGLIATHDGDSNDDNGPSDAEVARVTARLEKQIAAFASSTCCAKLKQLIRARIARPALAAARPNGRETSGDDEVGKDAESQPRPRPRPAAADATEGAPRPGYGDAHARSATDATTGADSACETLPGMRVENVLILALGSLSESTSPAPGYQLAAALAIIDVLKGSGDGGTAARLQILSYDPVYTRLDARILAAHGVVTVPASEIPTGEEWYRRAVVYMPHASVWLNHRYFVRQPGLWIGNSFAVYEAAVAGLRVGEEGGGSDVAAGELDVRNMLEEAGKVMREYERVEWPEEGWGGGAVFNNLVVYARRGGRSESAEEEGGLVEAVGGLKLE